MRKIKIKLFNKNKQLSKENESELLKRKKWRKRTSR